MVGDGTLDRREGRLAGRGRKADAAADQLGRQIASRQIAPGERLPTEAELGRQLGISRPSLREALRLLAVKGLVESRTRCGTTVRARERWNMLDQDVLRWLAKDGGDPALMSDLMELRQIFEPAAGRMAAARATDEQIAAIERAFDGMKASLPHDPAAGHLHDLAFHEAIAAATGNGLFRRLAAAIRAALHASFKASREVCDTYERSLRQHGAVAAAIRARNPDEAERRMQALLGDTGEDLKAALAPRKSSKRARRATSASSRRKHHDQAQSNR